MNVFESLIEQVTPTLPKPKRRWSSARYIKRMATPVSIPAEKYRAIEKAIRDGVPVREIMARHRTSYITVRRIRDQMDREGAVRQTDLKRMTIIAQLLDDNGYGAEAQELRAVLRELSYLRGRDEK